MSSDDPQLLQPSAFAILDVEEKRRAVAFRRPVDTNSYVAAHVLLRCMLSESLVNLPEWRPPDAWRFTPGKYGKPELDASCGIPELKFNISHARGMAVVAIALSADVGVDVESTDRQISDDVAIAQAHFSLSEQAWLHGITDPAKRRLAFLDVWTSKEAFIKAVGHGLSMPLTSFCVDLNQECYVRDALPPEAAGQSWMLRRWKLPGHLIALASARRNPPPIDALTVDFKEASAVSSMLAGADFLRFKSPGF